MATKKNAPAEQQGTLMDIEPENAKEIVAAARKYKEAVGERLSWLKQEVKYKQEILELAKAAKLKRDEDGNIRFTVDGVTIKITPCDDKVSVKFSDEGESDED